jgi:DNA-directed RNA polymerase III subunit RPC3
MRNRFTSCLDVWQKGYTNIRSWQIANISLLKQKEIRSVLSRMHEAGHLELQEVPRSNPPQVQRTYFLWYHEAERASVNLLTDVYKAMSRNIQRTNEERKKRARLLEKSERTDVQENYEEYMSTSEKRELELWKNREGNLLGQLMRLDRIVMILRDF